jgi:inosine-uridine nucleoside N-ribohydrolase
MTKSYKYRITRWFLTATFGFIAIGMAAAQEKVILDTDFAGAVGDDGQAAIMLAQVFKAGGIHLLGVTVVSGNTWVDQEVVHALRMTERMGISDRVKVYQGAVYPLIHDPNTFDRERRDFGARWGGAFSRPRPTPDQIAAPPDGFPTVKAAPQHAADFIIESVKKYPHEVTFVAIGPVTNIALAIRKAPEIVPLIKRILYMGGAFDVPGNTTPAAELNWWFDPEAVRIVVRSPIEQAINPLDLSNTIFFDKDKYDRVVRVDTPVTRLYKDAFGSRLERNPNQRSLVWDTVTAAYLLDPSIVTEWREAWVDMDITFGPNYGRSMAYDSNPPAGLQKLKIMKNIDRQKYWDLFVDLMTRPVPGTAKSPAAPGADHRR